MTTSPIVHSKVSAVSDGADTSLVRPSDWNDGHTVTFAAATDLAVVAPAASAGTDDTKLSRSDHAHQDSAAGRIYAYNTFR